VNRYKFVCIVSTKAKHVIWWS